MRYPCRDSYRTPSACRVRVKHAIRTNSTFSEIIECAIVEDVAVLVDLDKRNAFVLRSRFNHRAEMFDVDIDRARNERRLTRDRE
jgi:hypothetical protein